RAVLGDTWELAVLPPEPGEDGAHLPLVAALSIRSRAAAEAAIRAFEAELGRVWGLVARPSPLDGGRRATCFDELRVLPGRVPCWILGERSLLVGWSPRALERVHAGVPAEASDTAAAGRDAAAGARLDAHLDRFGAAEWRMAEASGAAPEQLPDYPWSRIEVEGRRHGERYRFELTAATRGVGSARPHGGPEDRPGIR
ncbi:MAG: hypothetical protein MI919_42800, partial [Holophagales bacterium]|nr:hypothetical protein [Holophagales bacterium]